MLAMNRAVATKVCALVVAHVAWSSSTASAATSTSTTTAAESHRAVKHAPRPTLELFSLPVHLALRPTFLGRSSPDGYDTDAYGLLWAEVA